METWQLLVAVLAPACAVVFGYIAMMRNKKSDTTQDARQDATVLSEIGYIKSGIDDIKAEQREQRNINMDVVTRLTAVEASAKQAHRRLDNMGH